jgi:PAS domain-containing protein
MTSPSLKEIRTKVDALEKEIRLPRSILGTTRDPFFILNRKGKFLKVNLKGLKLLNYSPEELQ